MENFLWIEWNNKNNILLSLCSSLSPFPQKNENEQICMCLLSVPSCDGSCTSTNVALVPLQVWPIPLPLTITNVLCCCLSAHLHYSLHWVNNTQALLMVPLFLSFFPFFSLSLSLSNLLPTPLYPIISHKYKIKISNKKTNVMFHVTQMLN